MERRSIGSFIAILRKASGLTQRELAEKLGVSDKAVSRWERDETAPDLYLIPVIAEIFGVTSDELLRGERTGENSSAYEKTNDKTERQIKTVLKTVRTKFLTKTLICALIAVVGLLAAMLCNFAFYRAELGFYVGLIFFAVAVILELIFSTLSFSALDTEELESNHLAETRKYIVKKTEALLFLAFELLAYILPLLIVAAESHYTNTRIDFPSWFFGGMLFAAIAAAICFFANLATDKIAEKKGIYTVDENTARKRRLAKMRFVSPLPSLAKIFLPIIALTLALHILCLSVFDYQFFLRNKGTVWENANDFVEYMQTPLDDNGERYDDAGMSYATLYAWVRTEAGAVKLRFKWKNRYVWDYSIGDSADTVKTPGNVTDNIEIFPDGEHDKEDGENITYDIPNFYAKTYSWHEIASASGWTYGISFVFGVVHIIEAITLIGIYISKVLKNFKTFTE